MLKGFKDFLMRGNVVDLAVAVVIGAAFGALIKGFLDGLITPLIAAVAGKPDLDNVGTFVDYLSSIVGWERFRASQFGIRHYCTIGLNSKEANNEALAEAVMDVLPRYLSKEGVVAVDL